MSRFVFELATPDDGQELLEILEESVFQGNISLLYTRRPDAYRSFKEEGDQVDIVVCRDQEHERIVGFGACAIHQLFVNGTATDVGYLSSLRIRRDYRKKFPLLHRGYAFVRSHHQNRQVSFYLTTILQDNREARQLLEKRRASMPVHQPLGTYNVYTIRTKKRRKESFPHLHFKQACSADIPELLQFLMQQGKRFQLFPVLCADDFQNARFNGLTIENFYILLNNRDEIAAAGAVWDQIVYKQYVVQGYHGLLKYLYPPSRWFPLIGFPELPTPGSVLKFFTLSFWAIKDNRPEYLHCFLDHLALRVHEYPFFLVGALTPHPLQPVLRKRSYITYGSRPYLVYWDDQQENVRALDPELPLYLENGML